jgi:hypothetical protein
MGVAVTLDGELAFPSDYVKAAELKGKDVTLTIAGVFIDTVFVGKGKKKRGMFLTFEKTEKKLGLNVTNRDTIASLHGIEARNWVGKRITIYPTTTTDAKGNVVDCIRIRQQIPA